jgi:hypothetical protein
MSAAYSCGFSPPVASGSAASEPPCQAVQLPPPVGEDRIRSCRVRQRTFAPGLCFRFLKDVVPICVEPREGIGAIDAGRCNLERKQTKNDMGKSD